MAGLPTIAAGWDRYKEGFLFWFFAGLVQGLIEVFITLAYPRYELGDEPLDWINEINIPVTMSQWAVSAIVSFIVGGGIVRTALWVLRYGELKPALMILPAKTALNLAGMAVMASLANFGLWALMLSLFPAFGVLIVLVTMMLGTIPFVLGVPFAVDQEENVLRAPTRSVATVLPRFFPTFGTVALLWLVLVGSAFVIMCPVGLITGGFAESEGADVIGFLIQVVFAGLFLPLYYLTVSGLYLEYVDGNSDPNFQMPYIK